MKSIYCYLNTGYGYSVNDYAPVEEVAEAIAADAAAGAEFTFQLSEAVDKTGTDDYVYLGPDFKCSKWYMDTNAPDGATVHILKDGAATWGCTASYSEFRTKEGRMEKLNGLPEALKKRGIDAIGIVLKQWGFGIGARRGSADDYVIGYITT